MVSLLSPVTRQSPLRSVGQYGTTVLYRTGREEVHSSAAQSKSGGPQGFTTAAEFGPILGTAMLDAAQSTLIWSHWERGSGRARGSLPLRYTRGKVALRSRVRVYPGVDSSNSRPPCSAIFRLSRER